MRSLYLWLLAVLLAAAPVNAYQTLSSLSYYMAEAEAVLLFVDLPEDLEATGLPADVSTAGGTLVRNAVVRRGRLPWVAFPTRDLPLGDSRVEVHLRAEGHHLGSASTTVRRLPTKANAVQIDRLSGGLIVGDLPFFPFGFYCYSPVQPTLAEEETVRGFNLMSPYQSNDPAGVDERRRYMDRAAEMGMKVHYQLLSVSGGGGVNLGTAPDTSATRRQAWLRSEVEAFRDHPALLAWYISDEPTGHGATPEQLETAAAVVRELDPYHPVTIVFLNPGAAARFSGAMDLAMTDPYPIPNAPPGGVADAVRTVHDAVAPRIPLWLVPQAFGGNEWWSREPTAAELRLMTWLGIVEGATGIQYFIRHGLSGFPKSPDTWAAASRAALEVAALTPFLLSPEARPMVETGDEMLRATAWRHDGDVVVAVVNTRNLPVEMAVSLPGLVWDRGDAEVLYEDRVVAVRQTSRTGPFGLLLKPVGLLTGLLRSGDTATGVRFDDIIDAYGVRLYRFAGATELSNNPLNMLIDPSFEWDAAPSVPAAVYADVGTGRGATYFVDSRNASHGDRSLRLHAPGDGQLISVRPYAPTVVPGHTYRFSVQARSDGEGAILRLRNGGGADSIDVEVSSEWRRYTLDSAIDNLSTRAWLSVGLAAAGTAWIDDMELLDISPQITAVPDSAGHTVRLEAAVDNATLRFRLDGTEATAADTEYDGPITILGGGQLRVGMFDGGRSISQVGLDLYHHQALGRFVDLEHPYSQRYPAAGPGALVDGILGTDHFTDGRWQGFEGEDLIAVIDLGRPVDVSTVRVRFLQNPNSWIWLPRVMEVHLSDDGRTFRPFVTADHTVDERASSPVIEELEARSASARARYIRIRARSMGVCPDWHPGAGGPAWIFADEIRIAEN